MRRIRKEWGADKEVSFTVDFTIIELIVAIVSILIIVWLIKDGDTFFK